MPPLNLKQQFVLLVAAIVLCALCLFVPWAYTSAGNIMPAGYALIFAPPQPEFLHDNYSVRIDRSRLLLGLAAVFFAATVAFYLARQ
jgi:hypothetical protein